MTELLAMLYKYLYFIGVKYNIALWNTLFPITFGFNENFSFTIAWEARFGDFIEDHVNESWDFL